MSVGTEEELGRYCMKICNATFVEDTDGKCRCPSGKYLSGSSCVPCESGTYRSNANLAEEFAVVLLYEY